MRRPRVVLYNPRAVFYTMPLALVALASALDRSRVDVVIIDGRLEPDPVTRVLEATEGAICLGISVLTGAPIHDALAVSRAVKAHRPDCCVVWGGWHPSLFASDCLAEPCIDVVVVGQGEETFVEIVERLSDGRSIEGCSGTVVRHGGGAAVRLEGGAVRSEGAALAPPPGATKVAPSDRATQIAPSNRADVMAGPPRQLRDLNAFPRHDYSLIPVERYFALKRKRQIDYISSQGCRFRCAFCADPAVYARGWTGLAPERVADELAALQRDYRAEEIAFQDETFFTHPTRIDDLADELLRRRVNVSWTATLRADQARRMGEALFEKAVRSGLHRVMIGVESGSQATLDRLKKDVQLEQVIAAAEMCARHDVGGIFNFIVGFPGESEESISLTLALAKRLRRMHARFETPIFYYRPYPGNPIAEQARSDGYVFPRGLEAWADFDYVGGGGGPWITADRWRSVERFKFYTRHVWQPGILRWPLRAAARWRCDRDWYDFPVEKAVVEWVRPPQQVS